MIHVNKPGLILPLVVVIASSGLGTRAASEQIAHVDRPAPAANQQQQSGPVNLFCEITPLKSTRADVELVFGKGKSHPNSATRIYQKDGQRVDIVFSRGPCELSAVGRWNVPKDVVLKMEITPPRSILIGDLQLDPNLYTRQQLSHPDNWVEYTNREDGLIIHSIVNGKAEDLYLITRRPALKNQPLRCK